MQLNTRSRKESEGEGVTVVGVVLEGGGVQSCGARALDEP